MLRFYMRAGIVFSFHFSDDHGAWGNNSLVSHSLNLLVSVLSLVGLKRTGKSCRLRWLNYLKPDVKRGNLTPEEQLLILELHSKWGNRYPFSHNFELGSQYLSRSIRPIERHSQFGLFCRYASAASSGCCDYHRRIINHSHNDKKRKAGSNELIDGSFLCLLQPFFPAAFFTCFLHALQILS